MEAVHYGSGTLCISTQVGCSVGCPFCLSGARGLYRNLTFHEMARQVSAARERGLPVVRATLSGIGEPLQNWENLSLLLEHFQNKRTPFSVTSIGSPSRNLAALLSTAHNGVMLSLHAGTEAVRRKLIPGAEPLSLLWEIFSHGLDQMSRRRRRKIGINYLLIKGVNDSIPELKSLLKLLEPYPDVTLHLLRCNSPIGSDFRSPNASEFNALYQYLKLSFPNVRRNNRWRFRSLGGCGTLLACPATTSQRVTGDNMKELNGVSADEKVFE